MLMSSGKGTRLIVRLILSVGEGAGVSSEGGGVMRCFKGIVREIGAAETGEVEVEAPNVDAIDNSCAGAGVSADFDIEGSGDSTSPGRLS